MAYVSFETADKLARKPLSNLIRNAHGGHPKHLVSARTIDSDAVDDFCQTAEAYEAGLASPLGFAGKTVALLFFSPARGRG
jgi:hypothetical protein